MIDTYQLGAKRRTRELPLPKVVRCSRCRTEWGVESKDCPELGSVCRQCGEGRIRKTKEEKDG